MTVSLKKGERISLEKAGAPGLSRVALGLSWGMREKLGFFRTKKIEVDLDASCILFHDQEPVDVVWFRQLDSNCGAIHHSGDDRSGGGAGKIDNEVIQVDLGRLPPEVNTLIFTVNSFTSDTFTGIPNASCRLLDLQNNRALARFDLSLDGGSHTGMVMAKLYRDRGAWHMQAIGEKGFGRTFQDMMPLISPHL